MGSAVVKGSRAADCFGAFHSGPRGKPDAADARSSTSEGVHSPRLRDEIQVGVFLNSGAFSCVFACTPKKACNWPEVVVKMIDKAASIEATIEREIAILGELSHPNVVQFRAVYHESEHVCIVMDRYNCDLVECMTTHWKKHGAMSVKKISHIARQMVLVADYLHGKEVCHRDIKGDNILADRLNLYDPNCRIVAADFGAATRVKTGRRMNRAVGTQLYWAPEFWNKDYSFKVDVWAIGVIMYGFAEGRFPFKTRHCTETKKLRLPATVHPSAASFIHMLLQKEEAARPAAAEALLHPYVAKEDADCTTAVTLSRGNTTSTMASITELEMEHNSS